MTNAPDPSILYIENNGPEIQASNFWDSDLGQSGGLYISVNEGYIRLLVPDCHRKHIDDMRVGAKHMVLSMLPRDAWAPRKFCIELLVEDGGQTPWSCQLSEGQIDRSAIPEDAGKQWRGTVWGRKDGKPHKYFERPAFVQIVPRIPWRQPIEA